MFLAMDYSKHSLANLALISLLLLAGALYFCLFFPSTSNPLFPYHSCWPPSPSPSTSTSTSTALTGTKAESSIDDLELALQRASTPNKTVIIAFVNKAYVDQSVDDDITMLGLFLESFWLGEGTRHLLDHLLLVTVDQTAYDRCIFNRLNCHKLETEGADLGGEKVYMSREFINMMWRRTEFLLDVLKRGYNLVFTDTDVMWLRNPFLKLSNNETEDDLQISVDSFNGDRRSEKNSINTGFYYVRSNNKTISLFDTWYNMKDNSTGKKEQDVLLDLMARGIFRDLGLTVTFLPTTYFSGFCQDSKDIWSITTVHANCCRHITAKIQDLKAVHRDWKRFRAVTAQDPNLASNQSLSFRWSNHIACYNSWREPVDKKT